MLLTAAIFALSVAPKTFNILFVGNSHTQMNDLPSMVKNLLETDGSDRKVYTLRFFVEFLNDAFRDPQITKEVSDPKWDVVVLQAAKASSSHKFKYDNSDSASLAQLAVKAHSRTLWFVEWPRRGWDESEFQMGVYRPLAQAAPGSELVPVCYAWDAILKKSPNLNLWQDDGNHASPLGTFLAANVFYDFLEGTKRTPSWTLPGISASTVGMVRAAAKTAVARTAKR